MQPKNIASFLWRTIYIQAVRRHYVYTALELLYVALLSRNFYRDTAPAPLNAEPDERPAEDVLMPHPPALVLFGPNTSYNERLLRSMVADLKALQPKPGHPPENPSGATDEDTLFLAANHTDEFLTNCSREGDTSGKPDAISQKPAAKLCVAFDQETGTQPPSVRYTLFMPTTPGTTGKMLRLFPLGGSESLDPRLEEATKLQYAIDRTHLKMQHEAFSSQEKKLNVSEERRTKFLSL
ncbi:uncharacterized protein LOC144102427 [Amblyomma americanum]